MTHARLDSPEIREQRNIGRIAEGTYDYNDAADGEALSLEISILKDSRVRGQRDDGATGFLAKSSREFG